MTDPHAVNYTTEMHGTRNTDMLIEWRALLNDVRENVQEGGSITQGSLQKALMRIAETSPSWNLVGAISKIWAADSSRMFRAMLRHVDQGHVKTQGKESPMWIKRFEDSTQRDGQGIDEDANAEEDEEEEEKDEEETEAAEEEKKEVAKAINTNKLQPSPRKKPAIEKADKKPVNEHIVGYDAHLQACTCSLTPSCTFSYCVFALPLLLNGFV